MSADTPADRPADLEDLKAIAIAADDDGRPWTWGGRYPQRVERIGDTVIVADCFEDPDSPSRFAEFIAKFDPPTVIALVAELERLRLACNICGEAWPNHAEACAYLATARERRQLLDDAAVLDGARVMALAEVERLREASGELRDRLASEREMYAAKLDECEQLRLSVLRLRGEALKLTKAATAVDEGIMDSGLAGKRDAMRYWILAVEQACERAVGRDGSDVE